MLNDLHNYKKRTHFMISYIFQSENFGCESNWGCRSVTPDEFLQYHQLRCRLSIKWKLPYGETAIN